MGTFFVGRGYFYDLPYIHSNQGFVMAIYIICVGDREMSLKQIGAVYTDEEKAKEEVKRLNNANAYTRAYYVVRYAG